MLGARGSVEHPGLVQPKRRRGVLDGACREYWTEMSRANFDLVVGIYDALNREDYPSALAALDDDFEFADAPQFPQARILQGQDARTYLREMSFGLQLEIDSLKAAGDDVLALLRERRRGGVAVGEFRFAHVWTVRDGRARSLKLFFDPGEAWDALGLHG